MRRALLLLVLALMSGALPASASSPGAAAGAGQAAEAFWVDIKAGTFYFAEGYRVVSAGAPESYVAVGKGRCTKQRMGRSTLVTCVGKGMMKEATIEEFFVDPSLKTAHIDVEIAKQQHTVEWSTEELPAADWSGGLASYGVSASISIGVFADATGTVFGHEVDTSSFDDLAFLYEGGGVNVYTMQPKAGRAFDIEFSFRAS